MASVEKRGNSWRLIAYLGYDELGKQIVRRKTISADGFSKAEAKRMAAAFESSLTKNTLRDTGSMTVSDFIAYWWDNYGNTQSVTTIRRNKELLVRIEGMLGHIKLSKLVYYKINNDFFNQHIYYYIFNSTKNQRNSLD